MGRIQSKAQWRLLFAKQNRGELPAGEADKRAHETPSYSGLPERKKKKKVKKNLIDESWGNVDLISSDSSESTQSPEERRMSAAKAVTPTVEDFENIFKGGKTVKCKCGHVHKCMSMGKSEDMQDTRSTNKSIKKSYSSAKDIGNLPNATPKANTKKTGQVVMPQADITKEGNADRSGAQPTNATQEEDGTIPDTKSKSKGKPSIKRSLFPLNKSYTPVEYHGNGMDDVIAKSIEANGFNAFSVEPARNHRMDQDAALRKAQAEEEVAEQEEEEVEPEEVEKGANEDSSDDEEASES